MMAAVVATAMVVVAVVTAMMMVMAVVAAVMMVMAVMATMMMVMTVMAAMVVVAMVVVAVVTTMMVVGAVMVAAVVVPTMPALAATKADTNNKLVADDVPAGTIPAVVVPTVNLAVPNVFDIATCRHDLRLDLRQRPADICRRRVALSDRPEAILDHAVPGPGAAVDKARLHAGSLDQIARVGRRRLRRGWQRQRYQANEPDQVRRNMARERLSVF